MLYDPKLAPALRRRADLWLAFANERCAPNGLAEYEALLSAAERRRSKRFRRAADQRLYVLAHALLRTTLSRYAPVAPRRWSFERGQHGRPEIAGPAGAPALRFNISHTTGLVACLVTRSVACGVDAENLRRRGQPLLIAQRHYANAEVATLRRMKPEAQRRRFFVYWTLKEAYLKARGTGLALPLKAAAFRFDRCRMVHVRFGPPIEDNPARWQFASVILPPDHVVAVALCRGLRGALELRTHFVNDLARRITGHESETGSIAKTPRRQDAKTPRL